MSSTSARIPVASATFSEADARAAYDVVKSSWVTQGARVAEFEEAFAAAVGAQCAVAMCNGTVTLHALLAALDIGPGDEVVLPTLTYIATANAVLYQGATPVLCECAPETYNVTAEILESAITPRTRAIITVDMNGLPIDYDSVLSVAARRGVPVIADSAESLGAVYRGRPVGGQARAHSFSFFGNKNITTGEGGMVTTNDVWLAARLRILRNQGQEGRYNHTHLGFNYRMTEVAAAIGLVQLRRLPEIVAGKERVVAGYRQGFAPHAPLIRLPVVPDAVDRHSWYMFAIAVDESVDRDAVVRDLEREGIETRLSFPPVHIQPYYVRRFGYTRNQLPISYRAWARLINLPIWPALSQVQTDRVVEATARLCRAHAG